GHYDVQPPEPLELWQSAPYDPQVRDGWLYARGANDDKGQLFTHLMAIEAYQRAGGGLPVNVKLIVEGEEEIGSPNMEEFIAARRAVLAADAAVISDSEFFAESLPSITYALRGIAYLELKLHGAAADCHSGIHGGALGNPINALTRMIAAMHDDDGRVTIGGFYDDVLPLADAERRTWAELPFDEAAYAASHGVETLAGGEKGYSILERRWARPTLDCNGIVGGYTGSGAKTIIPAEAATKITMRLVPNQDPEKVAAGFRQFVAENTPPGMKASLEVSPGARPVLLARDSAAMKAGRAALREAFGRDAAMIRCGASVPITELIQRLLGLDAVLMGFGLPDDNLHAPNERFRLDQLYRGSHAAAGFMHNLRYGPRPAK
ncbi:MAG: M20/M25/M40 family metallo-hydrolase, partial [Phycisphaerae bacterium]|nr:M20/M25/M40 family metallo-hydrolase [Phycisphaerae bacterium]